MVIDGPLPLQLARLSIWPKWHAMDLSVDFNRRGVQWGGSLGWVVQSDLQHVVVRVSGASTIAIAQLRVAKLRVRRKRRHRSRQE